MVYVPHTRVTLAGTLYGGAEIFNTGFALAPIDNGAGSMPDSTARAAIRDACEDWFGRSGSCINPQATLTAVKFEQILADGSVEFPSYSLSASQAGASATDVPFPTQCALVISLRALDSTRRSRGRMYSPLPSINLGSDGRLTSSDQLAILASFATFWTDVNTIAGAFADESAVVVASSYGTNAVVSEVGVGRVVDTMRSRRNALSDTKVYTDT
jgi:hypothetical protein